MFFILWEREMKPCSNFVFIYTACASAVFTATTCNHTRDTHTEHCLEKGFICLCLLILAFFPKKSTHKVKNLELQFNFAANLVFLNSRHVHRHIKFNGKKYGSYFDT